MRLDLGKGNFKATRDELEKEKEELDNAKAEMSTPKSPLTLVNKTPSAIDKMLKDKEGNF